MPLLYFYRKPINFQDILQILVIMDILITDTVDVVMIKFMLMDSALCSVTSQFILSADWKILTSPVYIAIVIYQVL